MYAMSHCLSKACVKSKLIKITNLNENSKQKVREQMTKQ